MKSWLYKFRYFFERGEEMLKLGNSYFFQKIFHTFEHHQQQNLFL